ncbi:MAG: DNA replication/repair protein RecF [Cytophagales bacterium]|nr:DNA replication/repair protein RecF [Cytophagales bacterium]
MRISKLRLEQFKNYEHETFEFHDRFNCLAGLNGAGKTNVLDALHYLAFTKSAFLGTDGQNILHDHHYFAIQGWFEGLDDPFDVICYQEQRKKKLIKVNKAEPERISEHIGRIPMVLTTPYDTSILREGSEVRRKFMDGTLSQFDHKFLGQLLNYQRLLKQRNATLKQSDQMTESSLQTLLDVYDAEMIPLSIAIATRRQDLVQQFEPFFAESYQVIGTEHEATKVHYLSQVLEEGFESKYRANRKKDIIMQRTLLGCHRDDVDFLLNDHSVKKIGSQGQQKTFIVALRLAQYDFIHAQRSDKPILMMDDIFDKLDSQRIIRLLDLLHDEERFGQVILTDAHPDQIKNQFSDHSKVNFFEISHGKQVS